MAKIRMSYYSDTEVDQITIGSGASCKRKAFPIQFGSEPVWIRTTFARVNRTLKGRESTTVCYNIALDFQSYGGVYY